VGLPHRLEVVAEADGVLYVNDSQGTTPYATIPALTAYGRPSVVILGGVSKGADWTALATAVVQEARAAVLIGQSADELSAALERAGAAGRPLPVERAASLPEAVRAARNIRVLPIDTLIGEVTCPSDEHSPAIDDGGDAVVPADAQVVALGDVVGEDDLGVLADAAHHGEEDVLLQ